jgi:hypothetical protein
MYRTSDLKSGEIQPKEISMAPGTLPTAARLLYTVEEAELLLGIKQHHDVPTDAVRCAGIGSGGPPSSAEA